MIDESHRRLIESICQRANRLSKEELAQLDDVAADLERNGTFKRRTHFASRHLVERFGGFDQESPTAEYEPTRTLLNSLSPSSSALPHRSDDAETANAGRGVVAGDLSEVVP